MNSVLLRTARARSTVAVQSARRNLSTASKAEYEAHHKATTDQWRKITYIAVPAIAALSVINAVIHFGHGDHEAAEKVYTYQAIDKKAFPWSECGKCGLFEEECWAKCRAAK